jgi:hypothetical protein
MVRLSFCQLKLLTSLFLILTIISILPLTISHTVDNDNNKVAHAQNQNSVFDASLSTNTGHTNIIPSNNTNYTGNFPAIPASISLPLSRGYVNGKLAYFIATDASDNSTALEISRNLKFKVNFSPSLALIPESSRQQGYEFLNGVSGQGAFGFQLPVASKLPGDKDYSPIVQLNFVKWNYNDKNNNPSSNDTTKNPITNTVRELKSVSEIVAAQRNNELSITRTNILINSPAVSVIPYSFR